ALRRERRPALARLELGVVEERARLLLVIPRTGPRHERQREEHETARRAPPHAEPPRLPDDLPSLPAAPRRGDGRLTNRRDRSGAAARATTTGRCAHRSRARACAGRGSGETTCTQLAPHCSAFTTGKAPRAGGDALPRRVRSPARVRAAAPRGRREVSA